MKRLAFTLLIASLLGVAGVAAAAPAKSKAPAGALDVMTQNQYLGADLAPIVEAGSADPFDPVAFNAAMMNALASVAANLPLEREKAWPREISGRRPHLVGLQEVFAFSCQGPRSAIGPIAGAFSDHLQGHDGCAWRQLQRDGICEEPVTLPIVNAPGVVYPGIPFSLNADQRW